MDSDFAAWLSASTGVDLCIMSVGQKQEGCDNKMCRGCHGVVPVAQVVVGTSHEEPADVEAGEGENPDFTDYGVPLATGRSPPWRWHPFGRGRDIERGSGGGTRREKGDR